MAVRDYWVYQKRQVFPHETPWALYVVKEYDRRVGKKSIVLDYTLYQENIENPTHSLSKVGIHYETVEGYVDEIISDIAKYTQVTEDDRKQLMFNIEDILLH